MEQWIFILGQEECLFSPPRLASDTVHRALCLHDMQKGLALLVGQPVLIPEHCSSAACCCCCCWVASVVSNSVRPHRRQPTRLPNPWDSPGKNTGVGCHFLLQCMKVKIESQVTQSCPTLRDPMDCSPPGSSVHGIFRARASPRLTNLKSKPWKDEMASK